MNLTSKQATRMIKTKSGRKNMRKHNNNGGNNKSNKNHRAKSQFDDLKLREKAFLYIERAPVVGHSGWEGSIKEMNFMEWISHYRICEAKWCVNNEVATEYEAFVYLYTASLATPFNREWYRIYLYLFNKFYGHLLKHNPIENVGKLTEYEKHLLWELRHWIFKEQMNALKKKQKKRVTKVQTES